MARVTVVKKSQKAQGRCEKCGKELPAGSAYKWCAPRAGSFARGRRRVRCLDCPSWRPSETTSSSARAAVYGAQEAAEDRLSAWDREDAEELRSILQDTAEGVREGASCYRESQENMESGFNGATSVSDELGEKADTLDSAADELESAADDIEDWEGEDDARSEALAAETVWIVKVAGGDNALGEYFLNEDEAQEAMEASPRTNLELLEIDAYDVDDVDLPQPLKDTVDEAVEAARDSWADEQSDKVSDALSNVEIP